jgi:hypothetical protein
MRGLTAAVRPVLDPDGPDLTDRAQVDEPQRVVLAACVRAGTQSEVPLCVAIHSQARM